MRRFSGRDFRPFLKHAFASWRDLDPELMAAGLSYFALFSLAPLLLVVLSLAGQLMTQPQARELILDRTSIWLTDEASASLEEWMDRTPPPQRAGRAAILGLMVAGMAGSQVLGYVKRILNRVWNIRARKKTVFWKDWLATTSFNLLMLLVLGLFLLFSVLFDALAGLFWKYFGEMLPPGVMHFASWLQGIDFAVSLFCFSLLFALIFRFIPDAPMHWEDVWGGALVTSLLLAIGKVVLSLYLTFATFASGYGAASSVLVLLFSVFVGANIFIFGSVFTRAYSEHYGSRKGLHKPHD